MSQIPCKMNSFSCVQDVLREIKSFRIGDAQGARGGRPGRVENAFQKLDTMIVAVVTNIKKAYQNLSGHKLS